MIFWILANSSCFIVVDILGSPAQKLFSWSWGAQQAFVICCCFFLSNFIFGPEIVKWFWSENGLIDKNQKLLFREAQRDFPWNCLIFHDIDLLPQNETNTYRCSKVRLYCLAKPLNKAWMEPIVTSFANFKAHVWNEIGFPLCCGKKAICKKYEFSVSAPDGLQNWQVGLEVALFRLLWRGRHYICKAIWTGLRAQ